MSRKRRRLLAPRQIRLLPAPTVPFPTSAFFAQNPSTIAGAGRTLSFTATVTASPIPTAAPDAEATGDEADILTSSLSVTPEATSASSASSEPSATGAAPSPPPPPNAPSPPAVSEISATEPGPSGFSSLGIAGISIGVTAVAIIAFLTFILLRRLRRRAATLRQQEMMVMGGATPAEEKPRAVSTASAEVEVVIVRLGSARVADLEAGFIKDGQVSGETVYRRGQARETADFDFGFQPGKEVSVVSQRQSEDGLETGGTWGDVERKIEEAGSEQEERRRDMGP